MGTKASRDPASTRKAERPSKPYPSFPLTPHASGKWQKRINGRIYYFGRWGSVRNGKMQRLPGDGWREALAQYNAEADDLHAGVAPSLAVGNSETVAELCDRFLNFKLERHEAGRITKRTFDEYYDSCKRLVEAFGKKTPIDSVPADAFHRHLNALGKRYGPVRLGNEVTRVRSVFKFGRRSNLVPPEFEKPPRSELRRHKQKSGKRLFSVDQVRTLIDQSEMPMTALIYLAINAGLGNSDVAALKVSNIDWDRRVLDFPREKTGIDRRAYLWPETLELLRQSLQMRSAARVDSDGDRIFLTQLGNPLVQGGNNYVVREFTKLRRKCDIGAQKGLGFYALRHTFRTLADSCKDFPAVRLVMGHADDSIDAVYREHIDDDRLRAVSEHVHQAVFGNAPQRAKRSFV